MLRAIDRFAIGSGSLPLVATGAAHMLADQQPPSSRHRPGLTADERATLVRLVRPAGPRSAREYLRKLGYRTVESAEMPPEWPAIPVGNSVLHGPDTSERALMVMAATLLAKESGKEPTEDDIAALVVDLTRPSAVRVIS